MRRFFVNPSDIKDKTAIITGQNVRHIRNVLRLGIGDKIIFFDGSGWEYESEIIESTPQNVQTAVIQKKFSAAESPLHITFAQAMLKDRKIDALLRQLTELGIAEFIPFFSERSIPRPDAKRLISRAERWEKIAQEAAKQCRRNVIPKIHKAMTFKDLLSSSENYDLKIFFWESESCLLERDLPEKKQNTKKILALIGPEGGFTEAEAEYAINAGFISTSMGPRILRAETAAIAACVMLQYIFGDMGMNSEL